MTIIVTEDFESRTPTIVGDNQDGQSRSYTVSGVPINDDAEPTVFDAVSSFAPMAIPGLGVALIRKTVNVAERIGPDSWRATVDYGMSEAASGSTSFDTTGGQAHITQSYATVGSYAAPGLTAPSFGGTIGVTESAIDGVDVTRPKFSWQEQVQIATVTDGLLQALFAATGNVNLTPWKFFAAGEVLFLGATGTITAGAPTDLTLKFEASPNATNLTIGDITGITKDGWDYLWVRHYEVQHPASKTMVKIPLAAYVERVYPRIDFNGIFTALGV